jgi:very-short-patch-repair endonuclease
VIAVIELDDRSHDAKRDAKRDQILKSCGYRVLRFQSKKRPEPEQIYEAVFSAR